MPQCRSSGNAAWRIRDHHRGLPKVHLELVAALEQALADIEATVGKPLAPIRDSARLGSSHSPPCDQYPAGVQSMTGSCASITGVSSDGALSKSNRSSRGLAY